MEVLHKMNWLIWASAILILIVIIWVIVLRHLFKKLDKSWQESPPW